jgi:N-acetylglucosaminyl-diphospho-decaprenol L-rhamnosyltransferase
MKNNLKIDVVIVSYYTGAVLWDSLIAAINIDIVNKVILVDNGNPTNFREKFAEYEHNHNKFHYIHGHGNIGFAKACNLGAKNSDSPLILFVNPDCIINEEALVKTANALINDNNAFAATAELRYPDGREQKGGRRKILSPCNIFTGINLLKEKMPKKPTYIEAISGAFMLFKRDKFLSIGMFDENYFLHVEDMDICLQIQKNHGKILLVPNVAIYHHLSTSDVSSIIVEYYKASSLIYYFKKNYPNISITWKLILFIAIWSRYFTKKLTHSIKTKK